MIHYDGEARRLFAREHAQLLQNEMQAARQASRLDPSAMLRRSIALLARVLRMRRGSHMRSTSTRRLRAGRRHERASA